MENELFGVRWDEPSQIIWLDDHCLGNFVEIFLIVIEKNNFVAGDKIFKVVEKVAIVGKEKNGVILARVKTGAPVRNPLFESISIIFFFERIKIGGDFGAYAELWDHDRKVRIGIKFLGFGNSFEGFIDD